ncbi:hypothetical protein D3C78_1760430 [compost metagenome]
MSVNQLKRPAVRAPCRFDLIGKEEDALSASKPMPETFPAPVQHNIVSGLRIAEFIVDQP